MDESRAERAERELKEMAKAKNTKINLKTTSEKTQQVKKVKPQNQDIKTEESFFEIPLSPYQSARVWI